MSLAQTLAELRDKFAKILPESATATMEGHIEFLRKSGAIDQIIKARGESANIHAQKSA